MKNTVKRILSIVLVVTMFATLGITAFADISFNNSVPSQLFIGTPVAVTAECGSGHTVNLSSSDDTVISISGNTISGLKKGTATVTAQCTESGCGARTTSGTITVKCSDNANCKCPDGCTGNCTNKLKVALSPSTVAFVGKTGQQTVTATITDYCTGESIADPGYAWTVENSAVATVANDNGKTVTISAAGYGTTTVNLSATKASYTAATASVAVTVKPATPDATGDSVNAIIGTTNIVLDPKAATKAGTTTPDFDYVWYQTAGTTLSTNATYTPTITEPGTYTYKCDVVETINSQSSAAKTVTFTVVAKDKYEVTVVSAPSGATSVAAGKTATLKATVIENTLTEKVFGTRTVTSPAITWTSADTSKLTVSANSTDSSSATVTGVASATTPVKVTAKYIESGVAYTDEYSLKVQNDFVVTLGANEVSVVKGSTTEAAKVVYVYDTTNYTYATDSASTSGYYYVARYASDNTAVAEVNASTGIITAKAAGTAKITVSVTVYSSYPATDAKKIAELTAECAVTVVEDNFDICANLKAGSTITFTDANFSDWYKKQVGDTYVLNSVYIGTPTSSTTNTGSFKYSGVAFNPAGSTLYTTGRTGYRYIANTSYTAGTGSYYVTVPFTCYGGTTTTATSVAKSGTLYILVNPGTVGTITYELGSSTSQRLVESDFLSVYRVATNPVSAYYTINIKLLDIPESGDLYIRPSTLTTAGTKLTASNFSTYTFEASTASNIPFNAIDDLVYVPNTGAAGSDVIRYAVYANNKLVYVSRIAFDNGESDFVSYSEGYSFKGSDFYATTDTDPVVSVKFAQPTTGKIYSSYANGRGVLATSTDTFYTYTAVSGQKPITSAVYMPPAGYEGNVSIKVTTTTRLGYTKEETIVLTVKSKNASSVFTDVTAKNTGGWSANAIDYAYKWGLVNGVTTTAPLKYNPAGNMTRAQFVAVLYRAAGSPSIVGLSNPFTDVKSTTGSWYYNAVIWAYHNKIVNGASATTYNPNGKITREQLAKMLYGFDQYIKGTTPTGGTYIYDYTDYAKVSSYAVDSIKWAVGNGIITSASASAKTINPQGTATRAQVATMLHRYLTK